MASRAVYSGYLNRSREVGRETCSVGYLTEVAITLWHEDFIDPQRIRTMNFPNLHLTRRISFSLLIGFLMVIVIDKGSHTNLATNAINGLADLFPEGATLAAMVPGVGGNLHLTLVLAVSLFFGELFFQAVAIGEHKIDYPKKVLVHILSGKPLRMNWAQRQLLLPAGNLPARESYHEELAVALARSGFEFPAPESWSNYNYRRLVEIAELFAQKNAAKRTSLDNLREASHVSNAVGLLLLTSAYITGLCALIPPYGQLGFVWHFALGLLLAAFLAAGGTWLSRVSAYYSGRRIDDLLNYFVIQTTMAHAAKSSNRKQPRKSDSAPLPPQPS